MEFKEIVLAKEEHEILSRLTTGESINYTLSSIKAPYFCRLQDLELIECDFVLKDGTLDITHTGLVARITPLGVNYFLYAKQEKRKDFISDIHEIINTGIAVAAFILSVISLIRC